VETLAKYFEKDDFVRVKGKVVSFQDHLQVNITHIERTEEGTVDVPTFSQDGEGCRGDVEAP